MAIDDGDNELRAIQLILTTLVELDSQARERVVDYVFRRLGLVAQDNAMGLGLDLGTLDQAETARAEPGAMPSLERQDIRSLKEAKDPKSAVEMAAIVAYYLAEVAPPNERQTTISTADLEKYFKQAKYPLPKALRVTLANAASSGYFDVIARGQYKLNPVGYNLVAHVLPGTAQRRTASQRKATKRKGPSAAKPKAKKKSTTKRK